MNEIILPIKCCGFAVGIRTNTITKKTAEYAIGKNPLLKFLHSISLFEFEYFILFTIF